MSPLRHLIIPVTRNEIARPPNWVSTAKVDGLRADYSKKKEALQKVREEKRANPQSEKVKTAEKYAEKVVALRLESALKQLDEKLGGTKYLILTITENGYGKRTDIDEYRLTARGAARREQFEGNFKSGEKFVDPACR